MELENCYKKIIFFIAVFTMICLLAWPFVLMGIKFNKYKIYSILDSITSYIYYMHWICVAKNSPIIQVTDLTQPTTNTIFIRTF